MGQLCGNRFHVMTPSRISSRRQTSSLTHQGRVTHICVSKLTIIGSNNGLSSGWRQAIIWTNVGILLITHLGTNLSEFRIQIGTFSFKKMHLKMSSGKWRPFCLCLIVLKWLRNGDYFKACELEMMALYRSQYLFYFFGKSYDKQIWYRH